MDAEQGLIMSFSWKKGKEKMKKRETAPALAGDYDLNVSFESGFLVLSAGTLRFRLRREDVGLLANAGALERAFSDADSGTSRRVFDDGAIKKFVRIGRLLAHGLNLSQVGALLSESETDCRAFYSWCVGLKEARGEVVAAERLRLDALDTLPLINPRQGQRPDEIQTEITVNGLDIKQLLQRDISKDGKGAAEILGISEGNLNAWLSENQAMLELLK